MHALIFCSLLILQLVRTKCTLTVILHACSEKRITRTQWRFSCYSEFYLKPGVTGKTSLCPCGANLCTSNIIFSERWTSTFSDWYIQRNIVHTALSFISARGNVCTHTATVWLMNEKICRNCINTNMHIQIATELICIAKVSNTHSLSPAGILYTMLSTKFNAIFDFSMSVFFFFFWWICLLESIFSPFCTFSGSPAFGKKDTILWFIGWRTPTRRG